jgi:type IV secretory pathway TraG/TraD family ATPase VirD4
VPPPPGIPIPGPTVKALGVADAGARRPVGLAVADARHHVHLLGATGSGKSTLMAQLVLSDIRAGRGAVVIDPKGDLVSDLLDRLPAEAAERVVLLDADTPVRDGVTPCLNPLQPATSPGTATRGTDAGGGTALVVDHLTSVFARVYAAWWGPRTDDVFRAACLTLLAQPAGQATLANLPRLLVEPAYRRRAVTMVKDPILKGFWAWYEQLSAAAQAQAVAPLMNKVRAFLLRPFVVAALAAGPATLDMRQILNGGLCLVRVPKGSLGEETTKLVGSLVVAATWQAATARAALPEAQRRDAALYVDECQNFLNLPYELADMLAEARGYRLGMVLAHQHLAQLPRDLREGLSANARNKVYFNASPDDARDLARHTAPRLGEHDLAHLAGYHAAARLVVDGADTAPFTLTTAPLPAPARGRAAAIRRAAARTQQARHAAHTAA